MQVVSSNFDGQSKATRGIRALSGRLLMSFQKNYNAAITFFTIGTSTIGGGDIIKGDGSAVQEWDKYLYTEYSSRLLEYEYTRQIDEPAGGMVSAVADLTLANADRKFSPNHDPEIGAYILPRRPIKLYAGFKGEQIPVFGGITERIPEIDQTAQTAKFHCIDFIQMLYNTPLDSNILYTDQRTDQIISALLVVAGLTTSQFVLDTGFNVIPVAFFPKGMKVGEAIRQLVQAELGNFYQDEAGILRFEGRDFWTKAPHNTVQFTLTKANCYDISLPNIDNVINVVQVKSNVRTVLPNQKVWEFTDSGDSHILVPAGGSVFVPADFTDDFGDLPVTSVDLPANLGTTSRWVANTHPDGSGDDMGASLSVASHSLVSTGYLMTLSNSSSQDIYVTLLVLYGTPAKVTTPIYLRLEDSTSVGKYEEHPFEINNDYIQDEVTANSIAQILLTAKKDPEGVRDIVIPALPQMQIGDLISLNDGDSTQTFYASSIVATMASDGSKMKVRLVKRTIETYFRIGISTIGGGDKIAP